MRFQHVNSFEKHLQTSSISSACRCLLIALADDQERAKILQSSLAALGIALHSMTRFQAGESTVSEVIDFFQTPSLFETESIACFDGCEKLSKQETQLLILFIEKGLVGGRLFLGARGKVSPLMKAVEQGGVVLDLTDEKPWDREKRFQEMIAGQALLAGKRLAPDAASLLIEKVGLDAALLASEVDKLVCYVGDKLSIERTDVFRISAQSRTHTLWQTAEALIWDEGHALDPSSFHGLIPALRSQLHLGLTLCHLIESRTPSDQWSAYLPKIWPRTLEKRSAQAAKRGSFFYQKALDQLFKIELLSRTGSDQYEALLSLFALNLRSHAAR